MTVERQEINTARRESQPFWFFFCEELKKIVDFARQKHRKFFKKETFHALYEKSNNNNNTNRQNKSNNSNCEPFFNSRKVTVLATPCVEYKKLWYDWEFLSHAWHIFLFGLVVRDCSQNESQINSYALWLLVFFSRFVVTTSCTESFNLDYSLPKIAACRIHAIVCLIFSQTILLSEQSTKKKKTLKW